MQAFNRDSQYDAPTAYLGNLAKGTVQGDFDSLFANFKLQEVRIIHDKETGEPKGYGYAVFHDQESLNEAIKLDGTMLNGQQIKIDIKKPRDRTRPQQQYNRGGAGGAGGARGDFGGGAFSSTRQGRYNDFGGDRQQGEGDRAARPVPDVPPFVAYIGNLPEEAVENDLTTMFDGLSVVSVNLIMDRENPNRHRGFGFAEFGNKASLEKALTLDGAAWMNNQLRVRVHERREGRGGFSQGGSSAGGGRFEQRGGFEQRGRFDQAQGQGRRFGGEQGAGGAGAAAAAGAAGTGSGRFARDFTSGSDRPRERRPYSRPDEPAPIDDGKERPKLVLQKKGEAPIQTEASSSSSNKPNPFGNARPVDTATKLRQKEDEKRAAAEAAKKVADEAPKAPAAE